MPPNEFIRGHCGFSDKYRRTGNEVQRHLPSVHLQGSRYGRRTPCRDMRPSGWHALRLIANRRRMRHEH